MTIKAVLFDLDETLLDRQASLVDFLSDQCVGIVSQIDARQNFIDRFLILDDNGCVWKDQVYKTLVQEFSLPWSAKSLLCDYVTRFPSFARMFLDARAALLQLNAQDIKLGIISNGRHELQMAVIRSLELEPLMEVILISESEGMRKPDKAIFDRALARLNIDARESVFVGDNPDADIQGAKRAGLKTVWKDNAMFPAPSSGICDGILGNFSELHDLIRSFDL